MSVLPILTWPDPRLSRVCDPVSDVAAVAPLIVDMFETMYAAPGRGLAAPQVGVLARVFVMDAGWKSGDKTPLACINPAIVETSEARVSGGEGCLSMPGIEVQVPRFAEVTLAYTDPEGRDCRRRLTGFEAICAQHELDHLDGTLHVDRLDADARALALSEYEAL
ncbi:peptide deformylase [Tropicibacter oceani]|uniref:Peptide deformylase n=1 Tax=Tropicibacter oceani TaxID=3058420 RepID=A0ABY8QLS8_9RHOB|nr:peptide deformylase [Tropicibacter oceani]WGW04958.1 peptide deformylase [Tropicibacter oceani]